MLRQGLDGRAIRGGRIALFGFVAFAALASAEGAWAQADGEASLEEVVVTAQRRSERLLDVPMSVVAVTPATIDKSGAVGLHDLNRLAPGVQVNFAGCCTQPAIRGISTLTSGTGFENNVALYVDGYYQPDNITMNGDLANVAGIEVLKGPQGALWGRNATGGAILITTKPASSVLTGTFRASYARFNDRALTAYVSGPISDRVRYSLAAYGRKTDGYNKLLDGTGAVIGDATPQKQAAIRAKLDVDITDALTANLAFNYGFVDDPRGSFFVIQQYASPRIASPPFRADKPFTATLNEISKTQGITREGTLTLTYAGDFGTVTSYTGFSHRAISTRFDFDGSLLDLQRSKQRFREDTFQQGVDIHLTDVGGVDLILGGTYYRDALKNLGNWSIANFRLNTILTASLHAEAWAGYADATVHLTEALSLNAGARYTWEHKDAAYRVVNAAGALASQPGAGEKSFSAFTPRASLRYQIGPRTNVYASISRGYRTGGFQPTGAAQPDQYQPFLPEKITAYEVGYKTASPRLQFEAAAFYYDYKDLQVGVTVPDPVRGGVINIVKNAPKAEVYGVDGLVSFELVDRLNVRLGAAYLHGRYKGFTNATATGLNITTLQNVSNQVQDWSDQQMARSPTFTANLGVDYEVENVVGGSLLLSTNINYSASYVSSNPSLYGPAAGPALANKQRFRQPAFTLVNAQATWTDASEHYKLTVFATNLTDRKYRLNYNGGAFGDYISWGPPRTVGVRAEYSF